MKKTEQNIEDSPLEKIEGIVDSIVYRSEDTGYTVCAVQPTGKNAQKELIPLVCNSAAMWVGEMITAEGRWTRHARHGNQFKAEKVTCLAPVTAKGIERYLGSGMVRGIGKAMAKRLVKKFGDNTLTIIDKESQKLEDVEGIGPSRRKMIKDSWVEQKAIRDIMVFLKGHEIGTAQSTRIYKHYGNDAIAIITDNPYRLCKEIWGIGFKTADSIAMSLGIPPQSEMRARAGLIYMLETMSEEGHCFCPDDILIEKAQEILEIPTDIMRIALAKEIEKNNFFNDHGNIYLFDLYLAEVGVTKKLQKLIATPIAFRPIDIDKAIEWAGNHMHLDFDPMQRSAIKMALTQKVSIITGGPGVGKTTIIKALVDVFKVRKLKTALVAPTGRAAKRMEEATKHPASTIHRLLKYQPHTGGFSFDTTTQLEVEAVIVDEMSMVDIRLMASFVSALPDSCILVMVGDIDQLPSVGPGTVLSDLIHSNAMPFMRLETIFRQEHGGFIVQNAHRINKGESLVTPENEEDSDFYLFKTQEPEDVIKIALDLVTKKIPEKFGFNPLTDIQLLTPMRKNQLGADNLNVLLQEKLNQSDVYVQRFGRKYKLGDRVMQMRNNYDKEVYNGDIGRISSIESENQKLTVDYDGRIVTYEFSEIDELVLAYACSIHKSQGSEYPVVVILMTTQHYKLLQRNLLYTAITRGRKLVCLVGSTKAIYIAISNNEIRMRRTGLREKLSR